MITRANILPSMLAYLQTHPGHTFRMEKRHVELQELRKFCETHNLNMTADAKGYAVRIQQSIL